jgi:hypothetical protein
MGREHTFRGTETDLARQLVGHENPLTTAVAEEAGLDALEFFSNRGAIIESVVNGEDGLELSLGGPVFFSVHRFLWDAASAIVGLAVALATQQPDVLSSAVELVKTFLSSISIFPSDTVEFQVYAAVAALQKGGADSRKVNDVRDWLYARDQNIEPTDLAAGVAVLTERRLLEKGTDDNLRILW